MKKAILCLIIFLIILYFGIVLRLKNTYFLPEEIYSSNNVVSYYVDITDSLIKDGNLVKIDSKRYSNKELVENAPPFLPIVTNFLFKYFNWFKISSLNYIANFNLILYVCLFLTFVLAYFFKEKNILKTIFSIFLLTFIPQSIELQMYGRYTEEFLGVFIIIIISFCEKYCTDGKNRFIRLIPLTLLCLAWQQFHLIFIIFIISNLLFNKNKVTEVILLTLSAILLGEFVSKIVFNSNYSPIGMLYEAIYPLIGNNYDVVKNAMSRNDWKNLNFSSFIQFFSLFGLITFLCSLVTFIFKKNKKYYDKYLFLGMFFTFLLTFFFIKSRFIFLPFYILFIVNNLDYIYFYKSKDFIFFFKKISKFIFLILFLTLVCNYRYFFSFNDMPKILVDSSYFEKENQQIKFKIKNIGSDQLIDKSSFSGMHIEVFNADVNNIKVNYFYGVSQVVIKNDANMKDYYWFEVKLNEFNKNKFADIFFDVKKINKNKPIRIKYRSWIPQSCSMFNRIVALYTLLPEYTTIENSWRNEKCILRDPVNNSKDSIDCSYKVHAAYFNQQIFKCNEKVY